MTSPSKETGRVEHAPTPWWIIPDQTGQSVLCDIGGDTIGNTIIAECVTAADADFIVRAVNAHDDLVKLLTEARRYVATCGDRGSDPASDLLARIDATLSRLKSEG